MSEEKQRNNITNLLGVLETELVKFDMGILFITLFLNLIKILVN